MMDYFVTDKIGEFQTVKLSKLEEVSTFYFRQGNLKGESVVAAIVPSRMAVSYCTS